MWKKLQGWLFNEEVEEYELDEVVNEKEETSYEEDEMPLSIKSTSKTQYSKEEIKDVPKVSVPKINIDIPVEPMVVKKEEVKKKLVRKEDYEMPPVISPFFGVKGETSESSETIVHKMKPVRKKESFNEVISPFYGKQDIEEKKVVKEESFPVVSEILTKDEPSFDTVDEDEVNVSLDQIITPSKNDEDDMIQFSLFGEARKLNDDDFDNENMDDDNLELPF